METCAARARDSSAVFDCPCKTLPSKQPQKVGNASSQLPHIHTQSLHTQSTLLCPFPISFPPAAPSDSFPAQHPGINMGGGRVTQVANKAQWDKIMADNAGKAVSQNDLALCGCTEAVPGPPGMHCSIQMFQHTLWACLWALQARLTMFRVFCG